MASERKNFPKSRSLGIAVFDDSIRYIVFASRDGHLYPKYYGEEKLGPGIVVEGVIQNEAIFQKALKIVKDKVHESNAHISLPESAVYTTLVPLPPAPAKDVKKLIELHLENHLPTMSRDFTFKYKTLQSGKTGSVIHVSVFAKELLDQYTKNFRAAGFKILSLEAMHEAIGRTFEAHRSSPSFYIAIGEKNTICAISYKGVIVAADSIPFGEIYIEASLAEALRMEPGEARHFYKRQGLARSEENLAVYGALLKIYSPLVDSLNQIIVHFHAQAHEARLENEIISHIVLTGDGGAVPSVVEYLSSALSLPAEVKNVWGNSYPDHKVVPEITFNESLKYVVPIGLALKGME